MPLQRPSILPRLMIPYLNGRILAPRRTNGIRRMNRETGHTLPVSGHHMRRWLPRQHPPIHLTPRMHDPRPIRITPRIRREGLFELEDFALETRDGGPFALEDGEVGGGAGAGGCGGHAAEARHDGAVVSDGGDAAVGDGVLAVGFVADAGWVRFGEGVGCFFEVLSVLGAEVLVDSCVEVGPLAVCEYHCAVLLCVYECMCSVWWIGVGGDLSNVCCCDVDVLILGCSNDCHSSLFLYYSSSASDIDFSVSSHDSL
jgi:hypothetical protein